MVPIIVFLVKDFVLNRDKWIDGFKRKLLNPHEYLPDPSLKDPSRRKTPEEMEQDVQKDMEFKWNNLAIGIAILTKVHGICTFSSFLPR